MMIHPRRLSHWLLLTMLVACLVAPGFVAPGFVAPSALAARLAVDDLSIYTDALATPWEDFSYGSTIDFASATAQAGSSGIGVTHTSPFGALSVFHPTPLATGDYTAIAFWARGAAGGSSITVSLGDNPVDFYPIAIPGESWTFYTVPLNELGSPATLQRINWQDDTGAAQPTYYLDQVALVATASAPEFPDATSDGARVLTAGPSGVAVAPNGRVYAAVYKDGRVYSWASVADMTGGIAPDKTFGVANGDPDGPTGCTSGPSATVMCGPESVAVDSNGNLFVADTYNHRVLVFTNPDTDGTPLVADAVLGQADLTSGVADYDSSGVDGVLEGLCFVRGLAVDVNNRLWVVDEFNYRVVRFDTPTVNGSLPSKVFGQADLDDQVAGCNAGASGNSGANQFSLPLGVAVDAQGYLYVADLGNNRVQRFAPAAANGANAEASYAGLNQPHDVAVDAAGNLYVADTLNSQVLVFGGGPNGNLGADHTFPARNFPMGMAFTATGDFLVADCGAPLENTTYPPCLRGTRGIYFFAAPETTQNQPPVAVDDNATTTEDTAVTGNVLTNDTDPQASALTVTGVTQPAFGSVTMDENGDFTYTPQAGFAGQDSFGYVVSNAFNLSDQGSVIVIVNEVGAPLPPNAVNDSAQTTLDTPISGNVLDNDTDPQGGTLTVASFTTPTTGAVNTGVVNVEVNGAYTFTPTVSFLGQSSFVYTVSNSEGLTDTATVTISVLDELPMSELFMPVLER